MSDVETEIQITTVKPGDMTTDEYNELCLALDQVALEFGCEYFSAHRRTGTDQDLHQEDYNEQGTTSDRTDETQVQSVWW